MQKLRRRQEKEQKAHPEVLPVLKDPDEKESRESATGSKTLRRYPRPAILRICITRLLFSRPQHKSTENTDCTEHTGALLQGSQLWCVLDLKHTKERWQYASDDPSSVRDRKLLSGP